MSTDKRKDYGELVIPEGNSVGDRLQMLLTRLGIDPRELNEACGFTDKGFPDKADVKGGNAAGRPCYLEKVILGRADLTPTRVERIASRLPVNTTWLMQGVGRMLVRRNPDERDLWECAEERKREMYGALRDLQRWDLEYLYGQLPEPEEGGWHVDAG